jgi:hypothetical protein
MVQSAPSDVRARHSELDVRRAIQDWSMVVSVNIDVQYGVTGGSPPCMDGWAPVADMGRSARIAALRSTGSGHSSDACFTRQGGLVSSRRIEVLPEREPR